MSIEKTTFVRIGAGSFATVFVWHGHNNVAVKIANDSRRNKEMQKEFEDAELLHSINNSSPNSFFKFPRPMEHYSSFAQLKADLGITENLEQYLDSSGLYLMERIWPIPFKMAMLIQRQFFPEDQKDNPKLFVCQICLGKRLEPQKGFFDLSNFPLDAERLAKLDFNIDVDKIAFEMGHSLSEIHFKAQRDGCGVKFILGGKTLETLAFCCIDFNRMQPWNNPLHLVDSFFTSDLNYPRPGSDYWNPFKLGYLHGAAKETKLAIEVLEQITARAKIEK